MKSSEFITEGFGLNYPSTYEQERGRPSNTRKQRTYALTNEDSENDIGKRVIDFYMRDVGKFSKKPVEDFDSKANELINKAPQSIKGKVAEIFKKAKDNPYIQGGVITTVASLLASSVISSATKMQLTPQQTNIMLQAILNTIVPTIISRINGKNWIDTIKYTLASAGIGTSIAAIAENKK
jgi:hypothetical protein